MTTGRRWSLRRRVALVAVIVLAGWVVVLTVGVNLVVTDRLAGEADDLLRTEAQVTADTVQIGPNGELVIAASTNDEALDVGTWILHGTEIVQGPPDSRNLDAQAVLLAGRGQAFDQTNGSDGVRWYAEPIFDGGQQVGTVVTALSLAPYQSTGQYTLAGTAVLAVLLLSGAYLVLHAGVARALRPVEEMTNQAGRWSTDDVDRRFGDHRRPAELDNLAMTLDALLDRLSAVLRNERQLSAEISHELRTPLARALAEIQLLLQSPDQTPDTTQALGDIEYSLQEMADILETLMTAARQQSTSPPGRCDVLSVVRGLADRRGQSSPEFTLIANGPAVAGVDAAVLERALSPLLDNAKRFAASDVDVEVTALRGSVRIVVRDDGPGIAAADLPHIFEPGYRGQSADGHQGAGLGLALANRLITAADGSISAANRNGHGAVLTVTVPAA
jgi:signal transduction histidine kinase